MGSFDQPAMGRSPQTGPDHSTPSLSLVQLIEATAKRPVTIQTSPASSTLSKCHSQFQSPLFVLPAEIREIIFNLATAPHYAPGTFFDEEDVNYRPDHKARWVTSVGLLATCRRIWLETNHLPMLQAHHCFYLPKPEWSWADSQGATLNLEHFAAKLTPNTRPLFTQLHVFADMMFFATRAKYALPLLLSSRGACPEVLTLTVRHVDWPHWTNNASLLDFSPTSMSCGKWLPTLLRWQACPHLREIRLELETLQSKIDSELRVLVAAIREQHALVERVDELGNQVRLELQPPAPLESEATWSGPTTLGVQTHAQFAGLKQLDYRIISLVWKVRPVREEVEEAELPGFAFSDADQEPQTRLGPEDEEVRRQWEKRWETEGSLLRFVD